MTDYRSMVNQDSRINLMTVGCRLSVLILNADVTTYVDRVLSL